MAIHICRDFLSDATTLPSSSMYFSSIFLFHVLGFTQVGHTAFNLSGSFMLASGHSASINLGVTGSYSTVQIPSSSYLVQVADVGRILALRSNAYPRYNSGLYRISSVITSSNCYDIEYRSTDNPPVETGSLSWGLFVNENTITGSLSYQSTGGTPTASTGYKSRGSYTSKRIILQSPHSSSWQVRFCHESSTDRTNHLVHFSVAPGFNGDSSGDFSSGSLNASAPLSEHLHGPMWFDVSNSNYQGTVVGIESYSAGGTSDQSNSQIRFYAWGDSVSGSVIFANRNVTNYGDGWFSFGLAEEDESLPPRTSQRLFVMGRANSSTQDVRWDNGPANSAKYTGVAFGLNLQPVNCVWALYDYVGGDGGNGPKGESVATDNVILGATELQKVDLWAGTSESGFSNSIGWPSNAVLGWDPRRLGSMPLARLGRSNFGNWTLTTDTNKAWFHAKGGVFLPWSGPGIYA